MVHRAEAYFLVENVDILCLSKNDTTHFRKENPACSRAYCIMVLVFAAIAINVHTLSRAIMFFSLVLHVRLIAKWFVS